MQNFDDIRNILVIRTDGIGDVINSTPAISELRETYKNANISVIVKPHGAEILYLNPDINEIIIYDPKSKHKSWIGKIRFFRFLRSKKFDTAIVLHNSSMSNFMAYITGAKYRVGRKSEPKAFSHTLTHWISHYDPKGTKHEIDRNLDVVRLLKVKNGSHQLKICLSDDERKYADDFLYNNGLADNNMKIKQLFQLVGIHPGGSSYDKLWLPENFAEIAERLISDYNAKVILFGGPNDNKIIQEILSKTNNLILATGVRLRQFASLVERCSLFICNDSGPMHIATALNVPTVAIFGPTDYIRWQPNNQNSRIVRKNMDCWPCSAHKCMKNFECTKTLPVSRVLETVTELASNIT